LKLPWSRLSPAAKRGLLAHALHWQAVSVGQLYVGIYLFRLSHGYAVPAWHALWSYLTIPLGSLLGAQMTRRWGAGSAFRAGVAVYTVFLLLILNLGEASVDWAGALGAWWGLGVGLYWQAWVLLIMDLSTEGGDRDAMMGSNQAVYFLANFTAAPLTGWYLGWAQGTGAYAGAFGLAALLFAAAIWVSLPLRGRAHPGAGVLLQLLRAPKPRGWFACLLSSVLMGVMTVGALFLPILLAYEMGRNEGAGGLYALGTALAGFSAAWAVGHFGHPERRRGFLLWSAVAVALLSLPLAAHRSLNLILLYGLGMATAMSVFNVPLFAAHIRIIESDPLFGHHRADAMTLRELAIAAGRAGACAVVLWGVKDISSGGLTGLLVGVAFTPLLNYLVMHRYLDAR
jgi:predicted MFS family arabinose efflux permease